MADVLVLYVEDEPAIAELLRSGLDLYGIEVSPIYDHATAAYEQIAANQGRIAECLLLVFDIRLPGMTGLELARKLRENGEQRPILIVSAYQAPSHAELKSLGAHFMPKPFDFPGIASKIQELVKAS